MMMALQTLVDPQPIEAPWYVILTAPQQDLTTVWRLHELGLELFVPLIRRRVKTGRTGRNGHKVTRIIARPMFPGYGFLRNTGFGLDRVRTTRGVQDFMRNERGEFVTLPHQAVMAVFHKQHEEQRVWLQSSREGRRALFKRGDAVRIDQDGGAYAGLLARVDKIDSRGRIEVLLGMIRHTLSADMVVAA